MKKSVAVLAVAAMAHAPGADAWSWPVEGPVLRAFVFGEDPYAPGQHRGIDIGSSPGTTVRAATAGTVSFAGTVPTGGRTVTVQTSDGLSVTYLELGAILVARGVEVIEGEPVGTIGAAAHVHFGVRVTADAQGYLDPLQFLPARVAAPARSEPADSAPPAAAQPQPAAGPDPVQLSVAAEPATRPKPEPEPVQATPAEPAAAPLARPQAAAEAAAAGSPEADSAPPSNEADGVGPARQPARAVGEQADVPAADKATRPRGRAVRSVRRRSDAESQGPLGTTVRRSQRRAAADTPLQVAPADEEPSRPATTVVKRQREPAVVARSPVHRRGRESPGPAHVAVLGCLAFGMLGVAVAVRRRRRRDATDHAVARVEQPWCPLAGAPPARLIHACARAQDPGWLVPGARPRRSRASHPPLPRPRRRAPVGPPA